MPRAIPILALLLAALAPAREAGEAREAGTAGHALLELARGSGQNVVISWRGEAASREVEPPSGGAGWEEAAPRLIEAADLERRDVGSVALVMPAEDSATVAGAMVADAAGAPLGPGPPITLTFERAKARDCLFTASLLAASDFPAGELPPGAATLVSVNLTRVPFGDVLEAICAAADLRAIWNEGSLSIVAPEDPAWTRLVAPAIEGLPAERGGQDVVGKPFPELELDRWVRGEAREEGAPPGPTLYRWWTDRCPFCERSLPGLQSLLERHRDAGLRVVGIYHPKPPRHVPDEAILERAARIGFAGPIAVDRDWSELDRAYDLFDGGRRATSVSFLVDTNGIIRFLYPGPELHPSDEEDHERCDADFRLLERAIRALLPEEDGG